MWYSVLMLDFTDLTDEERDSRGRTNEPIEYAPVVADEHDGEPSSDGLAVISEESMQEEPPAIDINQREAFEPTVRVVQEFSRARLAMVERSILLMHKNLETMLGIIREELALLEEHSGKNTDGPPSPPPHDDSHVPLDLLFKESSSPSPFEDDYCQVDQHQKKQEYVGIFTGEMFRADDGSEFIVSPNYASKSRLVQGDVLKLTVTQDGRHLFKQIGPIKRKRTRGILECAGNGQGYYVTCREGRIRVLPGSVSYHHGVPGDEVTCHIPEQGLAFWGAIESIRKRTL